jgi:adenylosuccinate synthase
MPAYAVIGGQWGDEGKGKVVDYLSRRADIVARFSGGNNAGHTVINEMGEFKLHLVPAGIFWPQVTPIIGNGVVVDADALLTEIDQLQSQGVDVSRLQVSDRAHLIMPYHTLLDGLEEGARGQGALGTTGRGVGPAYVDKSARIGIRAADLLDVDRLYPQLERVVAQKNAIITKIYGEEPIALGDIFDRCRDWGERLGPYIAQVEFQIQEALAAGKVVLLEGAQGSLLDLDHGTYPYVTSSHPTVGGASTGLGLSPRHIQGIGGVFKAYATRVGTGPFPTELDNTTGHEIRDRAWEYGTTTGRARRVGWFDGVAARYSATVNDFTSVILTRLDILDNFSSVKVCVAYDLDGQTVTHFPSNIALLERCRPIYKEVQGWDKPTAGVTRLEDLPEEALAYVRLLEEVIGCSMSLISTGPHRHETIQITELI